MTWVNSFTFSFTISHRCRELSEEKFDHKKKSRVAIEEGEIEAVMGGGVKSEETKCVEKLLKFPCRLLTVRVSVGETLGVRGYVEWHFLWVNLWSLFKHFTRKFHLLFLHDGDLHCHGVIWDSRGKISRWRWMEKLWGKILWIFDPTLNF